VAAVAGTAAGPAAPSPPVSPLLRRRHPSHRPAGRLTAAPASPATAIRIGYARCSTAQQDLASQLEALQAVHCTRIFSEKISTRIKVRPELEAALRLARDITQAAPDQPVILTVHELKRLARIAAELMTLSATLQADGVQLELLTGSLTGIYDPHGMGSMLFAILAVAAQLDRNYIREKTREGQQTAAARGNHGGRPRVIDDDMLVFARALKDRGIPMPEIARKVTIKTGKNAGSHPSVASLCSRRTCSGHTMCCGAEHHRMTRVVVLSSVDVLGCFGGRGRPDYLRIDDEHPCRPTGAYGVSKWLSEQACAALTAATGVCTVCLRPPVVPARAGIFRVLPAADFAGSAAPGGEIGVWFSAGPASSRSPRGRAAGAVRPGASNDQVAVTRLACLVAGSGRRAACLPASNCRPSQSRRTSTPRLRPPRHRH